MQPYNSDRLKRIICTGIITAYLAVGAMGIKYAINQSKNQPDIKPNQSIEEVIKELQKNNLEKRVKLYYMAF